MSHGRRHGRNLLFIWEIWVGEISNCVLKCLRLQVTPSKFCNWDGVVCYCRARYGGACTSQRRACAESCCSTFSAALRCCPHYPLGQFPCLSRTPHEWFGDSV